MVRLRRSGSVTRKFGNFNGRDGNLILVNSFDTQFSSIKFHVTLWNFSVVKDIRPTPITPAADFPSLTFSLMYLEYADLPSAALPRFLPRCCSKAAIFLRLPYDQAL